MPMAVKGDIHPPSCCKVWGLFLAHPYHNMLEKLVFLQMRVFMSFTEIFYFVPALIIWVGIIVAVIFLLTMFVACYFEDPN